MKSKLALLLSVPALFLCIILGYILSIVLPAKSQQARTLDEDKGTLAHEYDCPRGGPLTIHMGGHEDPDCPTGTVNGMTSYRSGVDITLQNTNKIYKVLTSWGSYFCPQQLGSSCLDNKQLTSQLFLFHRGDYQMAWSAPRSIPACGTVQNDLAFEAWTATVANPDVNNPNDWQWACTFGDLDNPGVAGGNAYYTYCGTGQSCQNNTPTPTPTNTPTPTATNTPTPTATSTPTPTGVTNTPTPTPTNTPSPTVTNTPTPTATGTQTPTPTSTDTPTPTVTNTPTPGPTATPTPGTTVTPTPSTLPKTGAGAEIWTALFGLLPLGTLLKKFAKKK